VHPATPSWLQSSRAATLLAAACGLVSGIVFIADPWGLLLWVALVPFFATVWATGLRLSMLWRVCLAWALPFHLCGLVHMTKLHSLEWRGLSWGQSLGVAYGSWIAMSTLLALGVVAWGLVIGALRPRGAARWVAPVALWVAMEWAQRHVPLALPWNTLAVSQAPFPAVTQIAAVTGSLGVTALLVLVNNAIALAVFERRFRACALAVALAVLNSLVGLAFLATRPPRAHDTGVSVRIVQGNIAPELAWKPEAIFELLGVFQSMTLEAAKDHPRAILWTETALPADVAHTPMLDETMRALARQTGASIGLGALGVRDGRYQNTFGFYPPGGGPSSWYAKRHLVPFGEYTPGGALLRPLLAASGLLAANTLPSDVLAGDSDAPLEAAGLRWGPLICFETMFPELTRASVRAGANVVVEVTNDAWFKDSTALVRHDDHGALRAVETRRFVVRGANTGVSSVIDPYGRVLVRSARAARATLAAEIWPVEPLTPYARLGEWLAAASFACLALAALDRLRQARQGGGSGAE
jgi:apolipoprotein N-acyltransferase